MSEPQQILLDALRDIATNTHAEPSGPLIECAERALDEFSTATKEPKVEVVHMHLDERGLDVAFKSDIIPMLAGFMAKTLSDMGAANYVVWEFADENLGALTLTLQRRLGEDPYRQAARFRRALQSIADAADGQDIQEIARQALVA